MKKNSFKKLLVAILVLAAVVLPVFGSVEGYKAAETETKQGVLTAANYYDYMSSPFEDIVVWATEDSTQTLLTMTGQSAGTFAWWYNFLLEYNETNGTWVVTKADMTMDDAANQCEEEALGAGKIVVMFHDSVEAQQKESVEFFKNTVKEGQEYYLSVDSSAIFEVYDKVDGVFLSTEKVEAAAPETEADTTTGTEDDKDADADADKEGVNPIVIVAVVVVLVAIVGIIVVVAKRKKAN